MKRKQPGAKKEETDTFLQSPVTRLGPAHVCETHSRSRRGHHCHSSTADHFRTRANAFANPDGFALAVAHSSARHQRNAATGRNNCSALNSPTRRNRWRCRTSTPTSNDTKLFARSTFRSTPSRPPCFIRRCPGRNSTSRPLTSSSARSRGSASLTSKIWLLPL